MKMENIEKMTSQIENLLDFVKTGEYKKSFKNQEGDGHEENGRPRDENTHSIKREAENKTKIRYLEDKAEERVAARTRKYEIAGDKEGTQKYHTPHNLRQADGREKESGKQKRASPIKQYFNYEEPTFQCLEIKYLKEHARKESNEDRTPKNAYQYRDDHALAEERGRSSYMKKAPEELAETSKFNFEFNNPATSEVYPWDQEKYKSYSSHSDHYDSRKSSMPCSSIDEEIMKIKSRIQSSEQKTREMEEKYLHTAVDMQMGKLYKVEDKSARMRRKIIEATEEFNKPDECDPAPRSNFELKIKPCEEGTHNHREDSVSDTLAKKMSAQVKLDQSLKTCREKFALLESTEKWGILRKILCQQGFTFSEPELKKELTVCSSEYNPFTIGQPEEPLNYIEELAEAFIKSEANWKDEVEHSFSRQELQRLNVQNLDLDKRGYLTIEDLVCFINLNSSNFFRNRDLMPLYRRLMAQSHHKSGIEYTAFETILTVL